MMGAKSPDWDWVRVTARNERWLVQRFAAGHSTFDAPLDVRHLHIAR